MAQQTIHLGLKIDADASDARAELNKLHQELNKLQTQNFELGGLDKEFREASAAAQELQKHLANATNKFGQIDMGKFGQSLKTSNTSINQLASSFLNAGKQGENAFRGLANQILNAQKPALSFSNILTKMGTTLANNIRWQISSSAINTFTSGIQNAWRYTKDMDTALTNIRVVTGKSRDEMDKLAAASNKMAKELKTTTAEMVKGQLIYYQQGDSAALAAEKARITAMAANVSFESSQEEMAEYLTAIWNSYQVGENELELFVDKLSAVGAATATSMEEIVTGMTKVAASANAVGVTYDQLNATIATISSTTRVSAESVGTAMKTIYARMGDLKVGKADEDGITYGQVSSTMKQMGIDIADANGQLRDMGEVVEEIGNKWQTFSKEEQQALVQAVAGKRQYTNLTALFENWDMYLKTLETSANAMGTLQKQQDLWADSWEGASNRVKASLEGIYENTLNSDMFIGGANVLAGFLDILDDTIEASGGLSSVILGIGGILTRVFNTQIVNGFSNAINNIKITFGGWEKAISQARQELENLPKTFPGFNELSIDMQNTVKDISELSFVDDLFAKNSSKLTTAQKTMHDAYRATLIAAQEERREIAENTKAYQDYIKELSKVQAEKAKINSDKITETDIKSELRTKMGLSEHANYTKDIEAAKAALSEIAKNYNVKINIDDKSITTAKQLKTVIQEIVSQANSPVNFDLVTDVENTKRVVEGLKSSFSELGTEGKTEAKEIKAALSELGASLDLGDNFADTFFDEFIQDGDKASFTLDDINNALEKFIAKKTASAIDLVKDDEIVDAEELKKAYLGLVTAGERVAENNGKVAEYTKKIGDNLKPTRSGFLDMASAAMSGASAGMTFTSAFDSIANGDIAGGLTSLISVVVSLGTAFATAGAAAGWIGLIATALSIGISLWQKYHKTAEEKIQDLNGELETLKGEIESLNGELTTTRDRISELQSKGTLSLVEQKELERCLQQEASLERQVRLKEQLESETEREKSLTWVEDNKDNQKKYSEKVIVSYHNNSLDYGETVYGVTIPAEAGQDFYASDIQKNIEAMGSITPEMIQDAKEMVEIFDDPNLFLPENGTKKAEELGYSSSFLTGKSFHGFSQEDKTYEEWETTIRAISNMSSTEKMSKFFSKESLEQVKQQVKDMEELGIGYIQNAAKTWEKEQNKMVLHNYTELFKGLADEARSKGDMVGYAQNISDAINEEILHNPELQNFPEQISNLLTPEGALKDTIKAFDDLPPSVQGSLNKFKDLGIDVEKHWKDIILGMNNGILSLDTKTFTSDLDFMVETVSKKTTNLKDILADFKPEKGFTDEQRFSILEMFPSLTPEDLLEYENQLKEGELKLEEFYNRLKNKDFDAIKYTFDIEVAANWDENKIEEIANAFGVDTEKVEELRRAYQLLADTGIAYAVKAADGSITYFNTMGEKVDFVGGKANETTVEMIALNQQIYDLAQVPGLSSELYNGIIMLGKASGWTKGEINSLLLGMSQLNGASPDLSGFIKNTLQAGGAALSAFNAISKLQGVTIEFVPKKGGLPGEGTYKIHDNFWGTILSPDVESATEYVFNKLKDTSFIDDYNDWVTTELSKIGGGISPGGINPSGGGGGGDKKSAQSKVYEATKKKYDNEIAQAEADLKADGNYAKYRQTVETAWSGLVTAFQGLNAEEKEEAKSEMQSTSLGVREVIAGYFDNIAEEWKEGYEQAEDEFGSEKAGMIADLEASAQAGLATLLKEGASKDLWDVYEKVLESSKDKNLPQEIRTYLETRRQEIWDVLQGLETEFKDYNILDFWTNLETQMLQNDKNITGEQWKEFFNKKLESLRQQLEDGEISIEEFRKQWEDAVNAGYYEYDLGEILPVFSFDEREGFEDELSDIIEEHYGNALEELEKINSVKDTLLNAMDEYDDSHAISLDTFKSLIEIGPEYLQLLFDENGQLQLNKQALTEVTNALTDQALLKTSKSSILDYLEDMGFKTDELTEKIYENEEGWEGIFDLLEELDGIIPESAYNDLIKYAKGLETIAKSASDAEKETKDLEKEISKNHQEIDTLQSVYGDLSKAQEEYNQAGAISVDTFQTLLTLEPQHLQYLFNEQGQLQLNEQAMQDLMIAEINEQTVLQARKLLDMAETLSDEEIATLNLATASNVNSQNVLVEVLSLAAKKLALKELTEEQYKWFEQQVEQLEILRQNALTGIRQGGGITGNFQTSETKNPNTGDKPQDNSESIAKEKREKERRRIQKEYEAGELTIEQYGQQMLALENTYRDNSGVTHNILNEEELSSEVKDDARFVAETQLDQAKKNLEKGLIDYLSYRKQVKEIISRGYYDYELGKTLPIFSKEEMSEMEEEFGEDTVSTYFEVILSQINDGVKNADAGFSEIRETLIEAFNFLPQEELNNLREQFTEGLSSYADNIVNDVENEYLPAIAGVNELWDLILENQTFLSPKELESIYKAIDNVIKKGINDIITLFSEGAVDVKAAISGFNSLLETGWHIEINEKNWDSLGNTFLETVERQEIVKTNLEKMIKSIETAWKAGVMSYREGMTAINTILKDKSFVFTDKEIAMYSNSKKQLEKYISAQKSLYNDGSISLKEFVDDIKEYIEIDPDLVKDNIFQLINDELDELSNKLKSGEFAKIKDVISATVDEIFLAGITDIEDWNKLLTERLSEFYSHGLDTITKKYQNILNQQDIADWGLVDSLGNEVPYKTKLWKEEFAEVMASFDSYIANYRGLDLINDETYQKYITAIKTLQTTGQTLATEDLNFSKNWIKNQKDLGQLTPDDEIAAYERIQEKIDSGYFKKYFQNEQDYETSLKTIALENYKAIVSAHENKVNAIANQLKEEYDKNKEHLQSLKTLQETEFDNIMQLREAQHEINLELQSSLTMYEYLDEETRKLIFNEEDYLALSDEILRIQGEITDLTDSYEKKIAKATTDQAELLTEEYETQVKLKMQEYEIAKANLDVTKKQMALQNVLNERNTRMFINGQWTWVANQENVAEARKELSEAEYEVETAKLNQEHEKAMNTLDTQIRDLDNKILEVEEVVDKFKDILDGEDGLSISFESLSKAVSAAKNAYDKGGEIDEEDPFKKEERSYQKDIVNETMLKKLNSMRTLNDKEQRKDKVFVVGDDTYKYEVIDRYGTYGWTKNGENFGNTNWYRVLTDTIMPAYRKLDDETLYKSYIATMEANEIKKEKEEKKEESYVYGSKYQDTIAGDMDNIISILSKMLIVDENTKQLLLDDLAKVDEVGEVFRAGQYSFVLQDKDSFIGSDGKTYTRAELTALIDELYKYSKDRKDSTIITPPSSEGSSNIVTNPDEEKDGAEKIEAEKDLEKYYTYIPSTRETAVPVLTEKAWGSEEEYLKYMDENYSDTRKEYGSEYIGGVYTRLDSNHFLASMINSGKLSLSETGHSFFDPKKNPQNTYTYSNLLSEYDWDTMLNYFTSYYKDKGDIAGGELYLTKVFKELENIELDPTKNMLMEQILPVFTKYHALDEYSLVPTFLASVAPYMLRKVTDPTYEFEGHFLRGLLPGFKDIDSSGNIILDEKVVETIINNIKAGKGTLDGMEKNKDYITEENLLAINHWQDIQEKKSGIKDYKPSVMGSDAYAIIISEIGLAEGQSPVDWAMDHAEGHWTQDIFDPHTGKLIGKEYNIEDYPSHRYPFAFAGEPGLAPTLEIRHNGTLWGYLPDHSTLPVFKNFYGDAIPGQIFPNIIERPSLNESSIVINDKENNPYLTNLENIEVTDGELKTQDSGIQAVTNNEDGSLNTFDETADAAIVDADNHNTQTMLGIGSSIVDAIEGIEIKVTNNYYENNGNPEFNAQGNIINRPTLSWVGEDGPEAIIPLSQKYRARGLSLWEEATKALGITPSFTMPTIKASFPQEKENMNVSQTINVTVQNEDSSNDFYAITNLL